MKCTCISRGVGKTSKLVNILFRHLGIHHILHRLWTCFCPGSYRKLRKSLCMMRAGESAALIPAWWLSASAQVGSTLRVCALLGLPFLVVIGLSRDKCKKARPGACFCFPPFIFGSQAVELSQLGEDPGSSVQLLPITSTNLQENPNPNQGSTPLP